MIRRFLYIVNVIHDDNNNHYVSHGEFNCDLNIEGTGQEIFNSIQEEWKKLPDYKFVIGLNHTLHFFDVTQNTNMNLIPLHFEGS